MKKILYPILLGIIIAGSWLLAPVSFAYYDNYPSYNAQFHPQHPDYYNGNQRLKLKKRADIERASASNLHYDQYSRDYYRCDWQYNKNLGTWVCEKSYASRPQPIQACPFGYTFHLVRQQCVPVRMPANAHLNAQGNGWQCNAGYKMNYARTGCERIYAYVPKYTQEPPTQVIIERYVHIYNEPESLPATGPGIGWALLISTLGALMYFTLKDSLN